jgi:ABC-2 type transport system permease protein
MTHFAGTLALVRFALRRDRVRLSIWVASLTSTVWFTSQSIFGLYDNEAELAQYATTVESNAALIALGGPPYGLDTFGGRIVWECAPYAIGVALMAVLTVVRHTRAEEEAGRTELLRATRIGRHSHSAAAFLTASGVSIVIGALSAAALAIDLPVAGSILFGAGFASLGVVFAGIALVAAQVTTHSRAATGIALAVLGAAFVLRAIGDIEAGWLSWLSPIGWMNYTKPFTADTWFPLLLSLAFTAGCVAGAIALESRRDVGGGLVADRPGSPFASPRLATPLGLAVRLQRAAFAGWAAGLALGGITFGAVAHSAEDLVGDNQDILDYLTNVGGASLTDIFLATMLLYLALLAAAYGIVTALRLRSEETSGHAEAVLAAAVARTRWAWSHLAIALGGSATMLLLSGLTLGGAHAIAIHEAGEIVTVTGAALAYVPAVWLLVGFGFALFGAQPRAILAVWAALAFCVLASLFGEVLGFPAAVIDASPFAHVGTVPATDPDWAGLAVLTALTAALFAAGELGFRRRDLQTAV